MKTYRNFLTQDSVRKEDKTNYDTLMKSISWFFFDLLFLGYVEDLHSGESFHLPGGLSWSIYVEVSVHEEWHFLSYYVWAGLIFVSTRQCNTLFLMHMHSVCVI